MRLLSMIALSAALHAGAAASAPLCSPLRERQVACLDGRLCECRHDPGGSLTGRPAGPRWNCGALRPACGAAALPPVEAGRPAGPALPPLLLVPPERR